VNATCTLSDAIIAANTDAASGGCTAGSGADTIVLPANTTFVFTEPYPIQTPYVGPRALPTIASDITIEGNGSTLARQPGAPLFGILGIIVPRETHVTLNNLTVQGGETLNGAPSIFQLGLASQLTLNHSRVLNNFDGGIDVYEGFRHAEP